MTNANSHELDYFAERTIEKWADLGGYIKPQWIYRGQSNSADTLKTSLERVCDRFAVDLNDRPKVETELRREFRRAYHDYAVHVPNPQNTLEWLSLMQHHGAPTRLLDFSYSIYVAAYFAVAYADADAAVWAVNGPWTINESVALLKCAGKRDADRLLPYFNEGDETAVEEAFIAAPHVACACPLNPFRLNERLRIQKGVFLVSGTVTATFMENLKALPGANSVNNVIRLRIPHALRREALRVLRDMNISDTSLFPGLDGFSRSLAVYHHVLDDPHRTGIGTGPFTPLH